MNFDKLTTDQVEVISGLDPLGEREKIRQAAAAQPNGPAKEDT